MRKGIVHNFITDTLSGIGDLLQRRLVTRYAFGLILVLIQLSQSEVNMRELILSVEGRNIGPTWVEMDGSQRLIKLPAPSLLNALSALLTREQTLYLESKITADGSLEAAPLSELGFHWELSTKTQTLKIFNKPPSPTKEANVEQFESEVSSATQEKMVVNSQNISVIESDISRSSDSTKKPATTTKTPMSSKTTPKENSIQSSPTKLPIPNRIPFEADSVSPQPDTGTQIKKKDKNNFETKIVYASRSKEDLFRDIFNKELPKLPSIVSMEIYIDQKKVGVQTIHLDQKTNTFWAEKGLISEQIIKNVKEEVGKQISQKLNLDTVISTQLLKDFGIPSNLNLSLFRLEIQIPMDFQPPKSHSLRGPKRRLDTTGVVKPNAVSGYLNLSGRHRNSISEIAPNANDSLGVLRKLVSSQNEKNTGTSQIEYEAALNVRDYVLEADFRTIHEYDGNSHTFKRRNIVLTHDWRERAIRFQFGDLLVPTMGYQNSAKIAGIGAYREFSLQPGQLAYPNKEYEILLEESAEVKIYVNENLIATELLDPGIHNFSNFPFALGESQVHIEIQSASGEKQEIDFDFLFNPNLLAKGKSNFALSLGLPAQQDSGNFLLNIGPNALELMNWSYPTSQPMGLISYSRGITEVFTLGMYGQFFQMDGLLGSIATRAYPLGTISSEFAGILRDSLGFGYAAKFGYTFLPSQKSKYSNVGFRSQFEYRSQDWSKLGPNEITSQERYLISTSLNNDLGFATSTLTGLYTERRNSHDLYSLSLSLRRRIGKNFTGGVKIFQGLGDNFRKNSVISANINYSLSAGKHSFSTGHRASSNSAPSTRLGQDRWDNYTDILWSYNGSSPFPENPKLMGHVNVSPYVNDFGLESDYQGNHGYLGLSGRRIEPGTAEAGFITRNYVDFTGATSLAFAGKTFAIGRPINNSFAIIEGTQNLAKTKLRVNDHDLGYDSETGSLTPALYPNLSPFSTRQLRVTPLNPPPGIMVENSDFKVFPSYRSGFAIQLGEKGSTIFVGTLFDANDAPLVYKSLTIRSVTQPNSDPIYSFTNAKGRFQGGPFETGKYQIKSEDGVIYHAEVKPDQVGVLQVGVLKPE
jgi:outer membrane usher protein